MFHRARHIHEAANILDKIKRTNVFLWIKRTIYEVGIVHPATGPLVTHGQIVNEARGDNGEFMAKGTFVKS
jgi:hypothetical protein